MQLTMVLEHRFARTPDGAVWTARDLARGSWNRYLASFERVRLVARVEDVGTLAEHWRRVDGDGVEVSAVPYYVGPSEYLRVRGAVRASIRSALDDAPEHAVILRVPGTLGSIAADHLAERQRRFAVEVVGNPYDVFAPGASDHPLRPLFRWWSTRELRRLCRAASAATYVTTFALQRRYPARSTVASFAASDVETGDDAFVAEPRGPDAPAGPPFRILQVGTLAALYKSPDVLIEAVGLLAGRGLVVELVLVGDGRLRNDLECLARRRGVGSRVIFTGHLPAGEAIRAELDRAHLFALPSRQEGMPRAMIEAMARAVPCLGSPVGGIPELLPPEALVPPDPVQLARKSKSSRAARRCEPRRRGAISSARRTSGRACSRRPGKRSIAH